MQGIITRCILIYEREKFNLVRIHFKRNRQNGSDYGRILAIQSHFLSK